MRHTSSKPTFVAELSPDHLYTYTTTIGSRVYVRARAADGRAVFVESSYSPTYYLPVDTHTGHQSFDGHPLQPHTCKSIRDGREFLESNPNAYGNIQPEYMLLADTYGGDEIVPDLDRLYVWNIDIEVDSEGAFAPPDDPFNEVTAITVMWKHAGQTGTVVYGTKPYTASDSITYVECASEDDLLTKFLTDWRGKGDYPDIVTGWNVQFYDLPYLVNRMNRLWNGEDVSALSPFRQIATRQVTFGGRSQTVVDIRGIAVLDYYELYRKFTFSQQESYRLDHIAHVELGKRKLSYAEYQSLSRLYRENYQTFIDYNIQDVQLVNDLDEKMKLIDLVCALAYSAKANYADTFKQVRLWDVMIYHYLRARGKQIPPRREVEKTEQYAGAYVKEPQVGQHEWVCSFDVASMYPHIIRQWNLSPETLMDRRVVGKYTVDQFLDKSVDVHLLVGDIPQNDNTLAANGLQTSRSVEGFLPAMLKTLYDERVRFKNMATDAKKQRELLDKHDPQYAALTKQIAAYNNQQMVRKVNLNSAYGALGSNYFRFYDTDMAEAVTVTGQYVIRHVANRVNAFLNKTFGTTEDYVIASDTDSIYVRLERVAQRYNNPDVHKTVDFLDQFCEKAMQKVIDKAFVEIAEYLHVAVPCLSMKREVIASRGVWTAKKRYILDVADTEGVRHATPKLKMMGIETVKSSTPAICREMLTKALTLMLRNTEADVWQYVREQREVFGRASFEQIAFPRSVNSLAKYETDAKSLPIAVRGALVYNTHIVNLSGNYEPIKAGQKIKFAYLKMPNRLKSNVISAPDGCPPEWQIETLLDYHTQWEKSFIEPLQTILSCIGWHTEKQDVLF